MITDQDAERCLDFIRDHAEKYALSKSQTRQLDHWRKIKRSEEFLRAEGTVAERQAIAETSEVYKEAVEALAESEAEEHRLKWLLVGAQEKIRVYQTMSSNYRKATS